MCLEMLSLDLMRDPGVEFGVSGRASSAGWWACSRLLLSQEAILAAWLIILGKKNRLHLPDFIAFYRSMLEKWGE